LRRGEKGPGLEIVGGERRNPVKNLKWETRSPF